MFLDPGSAPLSPDDYSPLLAAWEGNGVLVRHDRPTDTWIFIALHSSALGRPTGGTRLRVYPGLRDALRDAMRLAEGMTHKWAALGMRYGGGKAVLAITRPLEGAERQGLMHRYGELLESLDGAFVTGADYGTDSTDMAHIASRTRCVLGIDPVSGEATDPGPFTARGILAGMRSALRHRFGDSRVTGRRILVQGVGGVGRPLARSLAREGADLQICDTDAKKAERLAAELGATLVAADAAYSHPCDIFSPCAVGGVLNVGTISTLACSMVVGSANNQLLEEDDAERLARWGILYVPDYVVNAGGALTFSLLADGLDDPSALGRHVDGIGQAVSDILQEASATQTTPLVSARRRVDRVIAGARDRTGDTRRSRTAMTTRERSLPPNEAGA